MMVVEMQQEMPESPQVDEQAYYGYMDVWKSELEQNWNAGYVQMPNSVRRDRSLSKKAKTIYCALLAHMWFGTDRCWPSQAELAAATDYHRSSIIRGLQELYERGYIERHRPGLGSNNVYFINPLSFTHSFRPAEGPRTWYSMPHNNVIAANDPVLRQGINAAAIRPVEPFYSEVAICNIGSRKLRPEMSQFATRTIRNDEDTSEANGRYIRSGAAALRGEGVAAKAIGNGSSTATGTRKGTKNQSTQPTQSKPKSNNPVPSIENGGAAASKSSKYRRKKHAPGEVPPPMPDPVEKQLEAISLRFCDESPASSKTSMAWLYNDLHQRGLNASSPTFVNLLNEAIDTTVNRTPTIRSLNKDGSIAQMRYFWSVFEWSVNKWCKEYDASVAQQPGEPSTHRQDEALPNTQEQTGTDERQAISDELDHSADSSAQSEPLATEVQESLSSELSESELQVEPEPPRIDTDNPTAGFSLSNANHFGQQIRDLLGQNEYQYEVRRTRCPGRPWSGHYGFVITDRYDSRVYGEFLNVGQVARARDIARTLSNPQEIRKQLAVITGRGDLEGDQGQAREAVPPTESQEPIADTAECLAAEIGAIHKPDQPHRCGCTVYYLSPSGSEMCARCLPQKGVDERWYERLRAYYRLHLHLIQ
jgi:hypothetical protein